MRDLEAQLQFDYIDKAKEVVTEKLDYKAIRTVSTWEWI